MKKTMAFLITAALTLALGSLQPVFAEKSIATLRQGIPLNQESESPAELQNASDKTLKRRRAYPMQPPTIPHKIDNYQVDLRANKCLSCHSRDQVEESQAPMISVTHFMDRDGNFLADVSPRRYFCTQCHVTQVERKDLVPNTFVDVMQLLENSRGAK